MLEIWHRAGGSWRYGRASLHDVQSCLAMTLHNWWLFVAAVFLLSGTPGPNMLHVLTRSVRVGPLRSIATMAGCLSAVTLVLGASAAGLSALLAASPGVFDVVRYAGVGYLIWLGIKAWRGDDAPLDVGAATPARAFSAPALFRDGFLIGISNPKLLLFAAAFFPQFVDQRLPQAPQFAILVVTFAIVESVWYAVYALGGQQLARHLTRPSMRKAFDRLTGAIFVAFGVALLGFRR
jgi:threonine/homoserine/homoserine lactone efflux protein